MSTPASRQSGQRSPSRPSPARTLVLPWSVALAFALTACPGKDNLGTTEATAGTDSDGSATDAPTSTEPTGGVPQACIERCSVDADCQMDGLDWGYTCVAGKCREGCSEDLDCTASKSSWTTECTAQADCFGPQACIDVGEGVGRCAAVSNGIFACEDVDMKEFDMPTIEGGVATVCGVDTFTCIDGGCEFACKGDADCDEVPGLPRCNVGTGQCECDSDADCEAAGAPGFTLCKTTFCGCTSDMACFEQPAAVGDTCVEGLCSCPGDEWCVNPQFDGTQSSCEAL